MAVAAEDHVRGIHLGLQGTQRCDSINCGRAVRGRQPLRRAVPRLRREQAEPDLPDACLQRPETSKIVQVVHSREKRRPDGAVNRDPVTLDVSENAIVRGRGPARVVFGLKAVDRNHQVQIREFRPLGGIGRTALVTT